MHEMWLRLTVDRSATIVAAQAVTDAGPYGPACGAIAPDYGQLVGVRWRGATATPCVACSAAPPAART
jgi:hypothetical protein